MVFERSTPADGRQGRHVDRRTGYVATASGVLLAGTLGYIAFEDPHRAGSIYPPCPFRLLTGWNCPFCGGLRMTNDLLHLNLAGAVNDNVFALVGIPLLIAWVVLRRRLGRRVFPVAVVAAIVVLTIGWTVLRNMQGFPLVPAISG